MNIFEMVDKQYERLGAFLADGTISEDMYQQMCSELEGMLEKIVPNQQFYKDATWTDSKTTKSSLASNHPMFHKK